MEHYLAERYYWLKLGTSFFSGDEMKIVLSQTNGSDYAIFWIKLLLKAVEQSDPGLLRFKKDIPYDAKLLATVTDTDVDTVKAAIQLFQQLSMIKVMQNGDIWIESVHEMVGSEVTSAKRVRAFRARQEKALQGNNDVTPKKLELELELEKSRDREEIDNTAKPKKAPRVVDPLYNILKKTFEGKQPDGRFVNYAAEGKALNKMISEARARCPDEPEKWIERTVGAFLSLRASRDSFWSKQPVLPSVIMSQGILPRVLEHVESTKPTNSDWVDGVLK